MRRRTVGVLALQGDVLEHLAALERLGVDARPVRRPTELVGLAGIILPGGESTTIDKLSRAFDVREPLVAALRGGLPAFGSCAGLIMLADRLIDAHSDQQTFGGLDVTVRRNAFGSQVASFEADVDVAGISGGPVHGVFIRAPWVEQAGSGVEVLSVVRPDDGHPRIVAVRQQHLFGVSFHPEVTRDLRVHEYFLGMLG